jgi:hypothetical protein
MSHDGPGKQNKNQWRNAAACPAKAIRNMAKGLACQTDICLLITPWN